MFKRFAIDLAFAKAYKNNIQIHKSLTILC